MRAVSVLCLSLVSCLWAGDSPNAPISSVEPMHLRVNTTSLSLHHAELFWKALRTWGRVLPLDLQNVGHHGDRTITVGYAYGGPSACSDFSPNHQGDVAQSWSFQATLPCRGTIYFNTAYDWRDDRDFYSVALHEIGHALGLSHVPDAKAVMYYEENRATKLNASDRKALCQQYACLDVAPEVAPRNTTGIFHSKKERSR